MKKLILPFLALVLLATACKKEKKNYDSRDEGQTVRLTDISWQSVNAFKSKYGTTTIYDTLKHSWHFDYDEQGYLSMLVQKDSVVANHSNSYTPLYSTRETAFQRNSAHQSQSAKVSYKSNTVVSEHTYQYSYGAGNELLKITSGTGNSFYMTQLSWNNGRVTGVMANSVRYELDYNTAGNVTQIRSYHPVNDGKDTALYIAESDVSYDNQPNYIYSVKGLEDVYALWGLHPQTFSKNNVTRYGLPLSDGSLSYYDILPKYNEYGYISEAQGKTYTYEVLK